MTKRDGACLVIKHREILWFLTGGKGDTMRANTSPVGKKELER